MKKILLFMALALFIFNVNAQERKLKESPNQGKQISKNLKSSKKSNGSKDVPQITSFEINNVSASDIDDLNSTISITLCESTSYEVTNVTFDSGTYPYVLEGWVENGSSATASFIIDDEYEWTVNATINPLPTMDLSGLPENFCIGDVVKLQFNGEAPFLINYTIASEATYGIDLTPAFLEDMGIYFPWHNLNNEEIIDDIIYDGTYTLKFSSITDDNCTSLLTDVVVFTVHVPPTAPTITDIIITNDSLIGCGLTTDLTALTINNGTNGAWRVDSLATANEVENLVVGSGIYYYVVSNAGCSRHAKLTVELGGPNVIFPESQIDIDGNIHICSGEGNIDLEFIGTPPFILNYSLGDYNIPISTINAYLSMYAIEPLDTVFTDNITVFEIPDFAELLAGNTEIISLIESAFNIDINNLKITFNSVKNDDCGTKIIDRTLTIVNDGVMILNFERNGNQLTCIANGFDLHYAWTDPNGNPIGSDNATITITENGLYSVTVSSSVCANVISETFFIDGIGLSEVVTNEVLIYPNPSNGLINIKVSENSTVSVLDALGRKLNSYSINANSLLNIKQSSGFYIIEVENSNSKSTHKVVVQ